MLQQTRNHEKGLWARGGRDRLAVAGSEQRPETAIVKRVITLLLALAASVSAQDTTKSPAKRNSGPRVGVTFLTPALMDRIKDELDREHVFPVMTVFGWHSEIVVASNDNGAAAVVQGLLVAAGAEQGLLLPTATMFIGGRTSTGTEFGLGPSLSLTGVGMAFGVGVTKHSGNINIPLNVGFVTSKEGLRFSFLTGFNWRADK
jgi:hypothetical protein